MEETGDSKILETIELNMQKYELSNGKLTVVKTEDIKEEATNIDSPSSIKDSFGFESIEQMTFRCDIPSYEVDFESIKYEEAIKKEKITSHDAEMSINTKINYMKFEANIEHEIKFVKVENHQMDCGNEYVEHSSDGIEVDTYKGEEYETEDLARDSKHKNESEQHQSLPLAFNTKDESYLQVQFNEFHCELCDFKTKYKHNLLQHHRLKHDDATEIFHCKLCDYKTKRSDNLVRHHTSKHDDAAKILYCKLCDFKTKRKDKLLQHHRLKHDDAAEILHCKFCNYKTKCKGNLVQHHTFRHDDLAKIFHCERCDYKAKSKYRLLIHHRLKHDYLCEVFHCLLCDFKTKHKGYMLRHHRSKHDE